MIDSKMSLPTPEELIIQKSTRKEITRKTENSGWGHS